MAEGNRQARLDEAIAKLTLMQETQTTLITNQNTTIETLNNSLRHLTLGLQNLDAKVDQILRRPPPTPIPPQQQLAPPLQPPSPNPPLVSPQHGPQIFQNQPVKTMRLGVPRFSGDNPSAWVSRIQRYFDYYHTPDPERLLIASFHLDGSALDWYDWMSKNNLIVDWHEFLLAVERRFGPSEYEDHFGKLSKLTQMSSLADYQTQFEHLATKIHGAPEHLLVSCFVSGLRPDIRTEIQVHKPQSLVQAMGLARLYSDKLTDHRFSTETTYDRPWNKPFAPPKPDTLPLLLPTPPPTKPNQHFPDVEIPTADIASSSDTSEIHSVSDTPEISLHAMAGQACPRTLTTQQWKHHVFISFRGEDTRDNFVCHLYDALCRKGLNTFVDNQLRTGEEINPALPQAIHDSKVAIIIFSEKYASSSWCLDELLKIIECHETHNLIVIPVFYRVDPSDVRKQTGSFEESFAKHSENPRYSNKIQKWKDALTQAANKSGWDSDVIREDNKLIDQIVKVVSETLKPFYPCSLDMSCKNLKSFPNNVDLRFLEIPNLCGGSNLKVFSEISTNFRKLIVGWTATKEVHLSSIEVIEGLIRLQKLDMKGCQNYLKVPSSSCRFLSKITHMDMEGCQNLKSFPNNVDLQCLEILNLRGCSNLKIFPEISTNLRKLDVGGTAIKKVHSSSIEGLSRLQELNMKLCEKLESLPSNICKLQALQKLNLEYCSSLKKFPEILEPMCNLTTVCLSDSGIEAIPSSINNLKGLESLDLENCLNLACFPENFGNLVRRIRDFGYSAACKKLKQPHNILDFEDLEGLHFSISKNFWPYRIDRFDTTVRITSKSQKVEMKSDVPDCIFYLIDLPSHPSLRFFSPKYILDLSSCRIRELPKDLGSLYYLTELNLQRNDFVEIPASIKQLSLLESLRLDGCPKLRSLPQLPTSLCQLTAVHCESLRTLLAYKQPIFNGRQIKFNVNKCFKLEEKECQAMAYKLLRNGPKNVQLRYSGSRILKWFRHQTAEDIIRIKLPSNWLSNRRFFGFAFCVVLDCPDIEFTELVKFECCFEDKYSPDILFPYESHFAPCFVPAVYVPPMQFVLVWCVHDFNVWISERRQLFRHHCINMASFKFSHWEHRKIKECGITPLYMQADEGYVQGDDDEQDDADENAYWMLESLLLRKMSTKDMNSEDTDNDMIPEDDEDELFKIEDELFEASDELFETVSSSD